MFKFRYIYVDQSYKVLLNLASLQKNDNYYDYILHIFNLIQSQNHGSRYQDQIIKKTYQTCVNSVRMKIHLDKKNIV